MLVSTKNYTQGSSGNRIRQSLRLIPILALLYATHLSAQTVATYGFEDGTADGWTSFNGASTPVATTAAAYCRLPQPADDHQFQRRRRALHFPEQRSSAWSEVHDHRLRQAYQPAKAATNANFTIKRSDPSCSGGTCYDTIGTYQVPVSDSGWVQIGGSYTVSATETGCHPLRPVGRSHQRAVLLSGRRRHHRDRTASRRNTGRHLQLRRWRPRRLDALRLRDPDQRRAARSRSERRRPQPPRHQPHRGLHGAEPQSAERAQCGGGRDVSGHRLRTARRSRQHQSHRDSLDQDS